jgi:hypothetical protein
MDSNDLQALELLAQLQRLTPAGDETAMRITVRNAKGEWIGDAPLSARAAAALTGATESTANYRDCPDPIDYTLLAAAVDDSVSTAEAIAWDTNLHEPGTYPDPLIVAQVEDHFDGVDLIALTDAVLSSVAPADRMRATRAIDDMLGHIPTDMDDDL